MICHADLNERPTLGDIPVRYSTTFPPLCSSLHHILTQSAPHQKSKSTRWPECRSTPRKICNTQSWLSERPFCSERLCVVCPFLSLALYRYFFSFSLWSSSASVFVRSFQWDFVFRIGNQTLCNQSSFRHIQRATILALFYLRVTVLEPKATTVPDQIILKHFSLKIYDMQ